MKTIQERRKEYLDSKVAYYSEDVTRRAIEGSRCKYLTHDGRKCAIGLDMDAEHKSYKQVCWQNINVSALIREYPTILPAEVVELGADFLLNVQKLHDGNENWGYTTGLTGRGEGIYNYILDKFC